MDQNETMIKTKISKKLKKLKDIMKPNNLEKGQEQEQYKNIPQNDQHTMQGTSSKKKF